MQSFFLQVVLCNQPDMIERMNEFLYNCDTENEIFFTAAPPTSPHYSFFMFFQTTWTYTQLINFFTKELQEKNSWILIEITSTKVAINLAPFILEKVLPKIPQSSLEISDISLKDLPTINLQILLQESILKEDFEKSEEINKLLKDRKIEKCSK